MTNRELIDHLTLITENLLKDVSVFKECSTEQLNRKFNAKSWSILECIEHLNRYSNFYLPEIEKNIGKGDQVNEGSIFKKGVLGGYFSKSMLPKEKLNKMKTFKSKNPSGITLDNSTLNKFIEEQNLFLISLKKAKTTNLTKVKTATTLGGLVRFRLGDTLTFYVYHNWRHIEQAKRMLN